MASSGKTLPKPRSPQGEARSGRGSGLTGRLARQRRPVRIVGGAAFITVAALANMYFVNSFDRRVPVVMLARDVPIGQQISRTDVTTTRVAVDATVATIPGRQLGEVVGHRAVVVGLRKGMLLSASQVTGGPYPGPGRALVTVPLKTALVPPGLAPGWQVRVVSTPGTAPGQDGSTPGPDTAPAIAAMVDHVGQPSTEGTVPVSLVVAEGDSPVVSRQAALGAVALIVTAKVG